MLIVFDLDDTLYDEVDFVKSGFKEIANYLNDERYYNFMMNIFESEGSGRVFDKLTEKYGLNININKLVEIYRFHKPNIALKSDSLNLLKFAKNFKTALISDGHYIMQKNKFDALGLKKYIEYPIFTDFYQTKKPELKPYKMIMERFKDESEFIYISDNPKKDFFAVKELGWRGIRYKNPVGIYKNIDNNTDFEVENKIDIINILRKLNNE